MTFRQDSFRAAIRMARYDQRITLQNVADDTGLSRATLCRVERGKFTPSLMTYMILVAWLGVPPDEFFEGEVGS